MKTETEAAIKVLAEQINKLTSADNALKYSQAALNLAHVLNILAHVSKQEQTN